MAATLKLDTIWPARQQLRLTLPLPVVKSPQGEQDCPMLDEAVQFALDGQPPVSVQRGYYDYTTHDWSEPTKTCYDHATVIFEAPLAGGRLRLTASSPAGEASLMVNIPAAFQPAIVDPQPSYPRAAVVKLQIPPAFLGSVGLDALPAQEMAATCTSESPICFDVEFYKHDGGDCEDGGYAHASAVGCDGTTISILVPASADYQVDDLYLTYWLWLGPERVLPVEACVGFASCSGIIGRRGVFAPVTIDVGS